ncbi:hypothetical protein PG991_015986 [Apiospora marii]|uniref:Thioester reductase (TE) domain-containing protein n=2 Tax=Apiospora marii TaxID=335849 RepID=A0ABR1R081_9PEZI
MAIKPASLLSRPPPSPLGPALVAPGRLVHIDGYVASKWASEVLIEKAAMAAAARGMAAHIYRLSNVTGPDAPGLDLMHNLLRVSRAVRAVPRLTGWSGRFDFIRVEAAAEALGRRVAGVGLSLGTPADGMRSGGISEDANGGSDDVDMMKGEEHMIAPGRERNQDGTNSSVVDGGGDGLVEFLHLTGETLVPVAELKNHLERETGESFEELGLEDWLPAAARSGLPEPVGVFLSTLVGEGMGPFLPNVESSIF